MQIRPISLAALVLSTLIAGPAAAQISASDVWAQWRDGLAASGVRMSAADVRDTGTGIELGDVTVQLDERSSGATEITGSIPRIEIRERADGTVQVILPSSYAFGIQSRDVSGMTNTLSLAVSHPGLEMFVSRSGETTVYDTRMPELSVRLSDFAVDDGPIPVSGRISVENLTSLYSLGAQLPRDSSSTSQADRVSMTFDFAEPGNPQNQGNLTLDLAGVTSSASGALTGLADPDALSRVVRSGAVSQGSLAFASAAFASSFREEAGLTLVEATAGPGSGTAILEQAGLAYGVENTDLNFSVASPDLPVPRIAAAIARSAFKLSMPVLPTDEPEPFALGLTLERVAVDEALWALFDPRRLLPRDPANLMLEFSGMGRFLIDILDPQADLPFGGPPADIETLDLDALTLDIAGTRLTGQGGVTFPETNGMTLPMPVGRVDLSLTGANALLDSLVAIGLIPAEQAMGARMMIGLFATPGPGADELSSTIELREGGAVFANGQRIR